MGGAEAKGTGGGTLLVELCNGLGPLPIEEEETGGGLLWIDNEERLDNETEVTVAVSFCR